MTATENRKLIDNESKFREFNERVQKGFDDLQKTADKEGWGMDVAHPTTPFYFYCECSDENCSERIVMDLERYGQIHENRDHFIVLPGHETPKVERVIERHEEYNIVEKNETPSENVDHLQDTEAHNV